MSKHLRGVWSDPDSVAPKGSADGLDSVLSELKNCRDSFVKMGVDPHFYRGLQFAILMIEFHSSNKGEKDEID